MADVKACFDRLPLPPVPEEFKLPVSLRVAVRRFLRRPSPYVHIRRNIYLVKKPRKNAEESMQCSCLASVDSTGTCDKDCLCGMLFTSCSASCNCGEKCTNLPFQKLPGRKMRAVKTDRCGWGLRAEEDVKAGDFLVEYVGEVIDDETCEKRLWALKKQGESNFYMCEISREIVIDATYKGNLSRFINHSCSPNCELQKWDIEGEVRIGVFATQDIKQGEYINYDYQFIQFGTNQTCHCGASGCRGLLGKPQKPKVNMEITTKSVTSEPLGTRPFKRSKQYGSLSVKQDLTPIAGALCQQKISFGEAVEKEVGQTHICYQRRGRDRFVGLRVRVWWPLDQKFYHGKIVRFDSTVGKHQIKYDDGQMEALLMTKERWEVEKALPSQRKRGQSPVLDHLTELSPLLNQKRKRTQSPGLEGMTDQSPVLGQKRARSFVLERKRVLSPVLDQKNGQSSTPSRKSVHLHSLETKGGQIRGLEGHCDQSPILRRTRVRSRSVKPVTEHNMGHIPALGKNTDKEPVLEQHVKHSPVLQQSTGQAPVMKHNVGPPFLLEWRKGQRSHRSRLKRRRAQLPQLDCTIDPGVIELPSGHTLGLVSNGAQQSVSKQIRLESPSAKRAKSSVVEQEEDSSCALEQESAESSMFELSRDPLPILELEKVQTSLILVEESSESSVSENPFSTLEHMKVPTSHMLAWDGSESSVLGLKDDSGQRRDPLPILEQRNVHMSPRFDPESSESCVSEQEIDPSPTLEDGKIQDLSILEQDSSDSAFSKERPDPLSILRKDKDQTSDKLDQPSVETSFVDQEMHSTLLVQLLKVQIAPILEQDSSESSVLDQKRDPVPILELEKAQTLSRLEQDSSETIVEVQVVDPSLTLVQNSPSLEQDSSKTCVAVQEMNSLPALVQILPSLEQESSESSVLDQKRDSVSIVELEKAQTLSRLEQDSSETIVTVQVVDPSPTLVQNSASLEQDSSETCVVVQEMNSLPALVQILPSLEQDSSESSVLYQKRDPVPIVELEKAQTLSRLEQDSSKTIVAVQVLDPSPTLVPNSPGLEQDSSETCVAAQEMNPSPMLVQTSSSLEQGSPKSTVSEQKRDLSTLEQQVVLSSSRLKEESSQTFVVVQVVDPAPMLVQTSPSLEQDSSETSVPVQEMNPWITLVQTSPSLEQDSSKSSVSEQERDPPSILEQEKVLTSPRLEDETCLMQPFIDPSLALEEANVQNLLSLEPNSLESWKLVQKKHLLSSLEQEKVQTSPRVEQENMKIESPPVSEQGKVNTSFMLESNRYESCMSLLKRVSLPILDKGKVQTSHGLKQESANTLVLEKEKMRIQTLMERRSQSPLLLPKGFQSAALQFDVDDPFGQLKYCTMQQFLQGIIDGVDGD